MVTSRFVIEIAGYEYGLAWMIMPVMLIVFTFLSWRWIGPRTRALARNLDALTLPDFLAARFLSASDQERHPLRIAAALVVMMCKPILTWEPWAAQL